MYLAYMIRGIYHYIINTMCHDCIESKIGLVYSVLFQYEEQLACCLCSRVWDLKLS
jgi:hypothetical protein